MATVTMTFTGPLDGAVKTAVKSGDIPDEMLPYFLAYYRGVYGQVDSGEVDADGRPVLRDMTDEETFAAYSRGIRVGTLANVRRFVEEQVVQAARANVPDVDITPAA